MSKPKGKGQGMRKAKDLKEQMKTLKHKKELMKANTYHKNEDVIAIEGRIAALRWVLNEYELEDKYIKPINDHPTIGNRGVVREVYRRPMRSQY